MQEGTNALPLGFNNQISHWVHSLNKIQCNLYTKIFLQKIVLYMKVLEKERERSKSFERDERTLRALREIRELLDVCKQKMRGHLFIGGAPKCE